MIHRSSLAVLALSLCVAPALAAPQHARDTVNSYTPAEEQGAETAARAAGYQPGKVLFAQAGNFFFNGIKDGRSYALTVTPEGKVYASTPLPPLSTADSRPS